jgi:hypothetical protein
LIFYLPLFLHSAQRVLVALQESVMMRTNVNTLFQVKLQVLDLNTAV